MNEYLQWAVLLILVPWLLWKTYWQSVINEFTVSSAERDNTIHDSQNSSIRGLTELAESHHERLVDFRHRIEALERNSAPPSKSGIDNQASNSAK